MGITKEKALELFASDDLLGIGISFNYYLDAHDVESLLYLQLGPPTHTP